MIGKPEYVQAFHFDTYEIVTIARRGVLLPLPCCPGWTVAHLLGHLGEIYVALAKNIRVGKGEDVVNELEDLDLDPEFEEWFRHGHGVEALPSNVVEWFAEVAATLEEVFRESDPKERTWTWFPRDQTVGFWLRRMAHETAVHRWDAQMVHGDANPIDADLVRDAIDETLDIYQPFVNRREAKPRGDGEIFHFHRSDGAGDWWVRFEGADMEVTHTPLRSDLTIEGTGSDLLLFLWHRIPTKDLTIEGDRFLADRYFDLVPPD